MRKVCFLIIVFISTFISSCYNMGQYSSQNAQVMENCNYDKVTGKTEIIFREFSPSLIKYGYSGISYQPSTLSKSLPYSGYVGRHGKIIDTIIINYSTEFYKILLDNCEIVYARKSINGNIYFDQEGGEISGTYTLTQLNNAKNLIGKFIWINQTTWKYRKQKLITDNKDISYPINHLEKVFVKSIYFPTIGHSYGVNKFFLEVKKDSGESGYIGYNNQNYYIENPIDDTWSQKIVDLIKNNKVSIGMNKKQLLLSWGQPDDINRTVGSWGVHEQWIYGSKYLYLENDILTSFQD